MKQPSLVFLGFVFASATTIAAADNGQAPDPATGPEIHIEDVARFYQLYDASGGHPTAASSAGPWTYTDDLGQRVTTRQQRPHCGRHWPPTRDCG